MHHAAKVSGEPFVTDAAAAANVCFVLLDEATRPRKLSHQIVNGNDPLQNETVEKCHNGDGFTCAGLQYDPCHEHPGHSCDDPSDEGVSGLMRLHIVPKCQNVPYVALNAKSAHLHNIQMSFHTVSGQSRSCSCRF